MINKMNENKLISVIVPVYKVEQYLDRCINSLVNQSYSHIEIILVDDGSPDRCYQICEDWAQRDLRIKVVHKTNGGLSDARNMGLEIAGGSYICFVDSDDYVAKRYIEVLYNLISNNHTEMSAVSYKEVFSVKQEKDDNIIKEELITVFDGNDAIRQLFSNNTFSNYAWNKMYKRELFENVRFPVGRKMEDLGTTYKLLLNAKRIAYSTEVLYYYYQREDSILHKVNLDFYRDKFLLSKERYEKIQSIYPELKENDFFYLGVLLETYPKLNGLIEYDWIDATKRAFAKCKKMVNSKGKVKCFIFMYCSRFYRYINKDK
mgnify:CR=1 FL=1